MKIKKNDLFMGIYLLSAVLFFIISIPSWLLDILLAFNIGVAMVILFNTLFAKELFHITTCYNRGDSESTILAFQEWKEYEDKVKNNLIDVNNEL